MPAFLARVREELRSAGSATTGIGSLPFDSLDDALTHVFTHYSQPFLPQLPRLQRHAAPLVPMLDEILTEKMGKAFVRQDGPLFESALEEALVSQQAEEQWRRQPATHAFLARLASAKLPVKAQLIGPLTASQLIGAARLARPLGDDGLHRLLWQWIGTLSATLMQMLHHETGDAVTLIWDDGPWLVKADATTRSSYLGLFDALRSLGKVGLHSCAPLDVAALTSLLPGATLALDLTVTDILHPRAWRAVCEHLSHDGRFIFGVVDTASATLDLAAAKARAQKLTTALDAAALTKPWRAQVAWSGGCGTGLRKLAFERQLAAGLRDISLACALG